MKEQGHLPFDDTLVLDDLEGPSFGTSTSSNPRLIVSIPTSSEVSSNLSQQKSDSSIKPTTSNPKMSSEATSDSGVSSNSHASSAGINNSNDISMLRRYVTVGILFLVNLLNYMDRFTIAGILPQVKKHFLKADGSNIEDGDAGLLQAIFIVGYMLMSPVFGYAGDRYNRKYLMVGGIFFWSAVTLAGSFVPGNYFWLFVVIRGFVGVGEASYSTIAPTLISDMFVKEKRSMMLMIFYFAIPVGSGLGYIVGSAVASLAGTWSAALQVTPGLGALCCILILLVAHEPPRGMAEGAVSHSSSSSIFQDIRQLLKNKTFMLSTIGFTCVAFVAGALALFAPQFMIDAYRVAGDYNTENSTISLYFGIITCMAGFVGVAIGSVSSTYIKRYHANGDALVCAFGLLVSAPFFYAALVVVENSLNGAWVLIFFGETLVFLNWALVADMLLYTVIPTRRSAAEAMQIFISHLFGDAGSPYLIGVISDELRGDGKTHYDMFFSMQYSLYICTFIAVLGGGFFLFASLFIVADKKKAEAVAKGLSENGTRAAVPQADDLAPLLDHNYDDDDAPLIIG